MDVSEAIQRRRSIKRFQDKPVPRADLERLLDAATRAPNHRMTQPWRFHVLGPEARAAYGLALGERKARKVEDPEAARAVRERTAQEHRNLPEMIAVGMLLHENDEIREEDYAAVMMGIGAMSLLAVEMGLGTHIKTGGVMGDAAARSAAGAAEGERIVAIVNVGFPAEVPPPKDRRPAAELTDWRP